MTLAQDEGRLRELRSDARENREKILVAARKLFATAGPDVPMDEVARLAGVGKGTLYRRFPDRHQLLAAVARDTFTQLAELLGQVRQAEDDPWIALCRYLREWAGLRLGAVYDALCTDLPSILATDPDLRATRARWLEDLERLVADARERGYLRRDIRAGDIVVFMNLLQHAQSGPPQMERSAERFLELTLDGLSAHRDVPLPGSALTAKALA